MRRLRAGPAVAGLALTKLALQMAFSGRYGWHRDELYFVAASKRLDFAYVDFLPVTPVLTRVSRAMFGESFVGVRLWPALAGALLVVLAALIARELGGGRGAQILAAFATLASPLFLGMNSILNTVSFETTVWALIAWLFIRLFRTDDARLWIPLGAAAALALQTKYTLLAYFAAVGIAMLATDARRLLRTPWPWLAGAAVLVTHLPALVWQARHGWPVLEFVANQGTGAAVLGLRGRPGFLASLVILPGPLVLPLLIGGLVWLWRSERFRAVAVMNGAVLAVFLAAGGKGYYAAPALAVLIGAGAVWAAQVASKVPRRWAVVAAVNGLGALPLTLAVLPADVLVRTPVIYEARPDYADMFGWQEMAETVASVRATLPDDEVGVVGGNYGIAAAIEFYAEDFGLPPAVSGHNAYYFWYPEDFEPTALIVLGFTRENLERSFHEVREVATVTNRLGVGNQEYGRPVFVVREPVRPLRELFTDLKSFRA